MYDPELPAGFQDGDFEMRALEEVGRRSAAAKKRGLCDHGWRQGKSGREHVPSDIVKCLNCGKVAPEGELDRERAEILGL